MHVPLASLRLFSGSLKGATAVGTVTSLGFILNSDELNKKITAPVVTLQSRKSTNFTVAPAMSEPMITPNDLDFRPVDDLLDFNKKIGATSSSVASIESLKAANLSIAPALQEPMITPDELDFRPVDDLNALPVEDMEVVSMDDLYARSVYNPLKNVSSWMSRLIPSVSLL